MLPKRLFSCKEHNQAVQLKSFRRCEVEVQKNSRLLGFIIAIVWLSLYDCTVFLDNININEITAQRLRNPAKVDS